MTVDDSMIGIWSIDKSKTDYVFTRNTDYKAEFPYWSKTKSFQLEKKDKFRIVFTGESVARGFLYDPHLTPAEYLENRMNYHAAGNKYEIIDLARLGMKIEQLETIINQSLILNPDYIVIFAGNNFRESIFPLDPQEINKYSEYLEKGQPIEGIKKIIISKIDNLIKKLFGTIKSIIHEKHIQILFIIPEFNLKDWKTNSYERELFWGVQNIGEWVDQKKLLNDALKRKNYDECKKYILNLLQLNDTYTYAYECYGDLLYALGDIEKARHWYEKARDSRLFNWRRASVCTGQIKEQIVDLAKQCSCHILDLPQSFKELFPNEISGRNLFLDNCHMTSEGIALSMELAAQFLLNDIESLAIDDIRIPSHVVGSDIEAKAYFSAAIYNVSWLFNGLYQKSYCQEYFSKMIFLA